MRQEQNIDSKAIESLRFPLTFLVVMQHCRGNISMETCWHDFLTLQLAAEDLYYGIKIFFSGGLSLIAVPSFFFISGYLFFRRVTFFNWAVYKQKIKKRARSLLIPFLLWNLLCVPLTCFTRYFENFGPHANQAVADVINNIRWGGHIFWDYSTNVNPIPNLFGLYSVYIAPLLGTMWFVRDLIIMSVLSPLVFWFVRKAGIYGIILLTLLYLLRIWPMILLNQISVYFFTLGAFFSLQRGNLSIPKQTSNCMYVISLILLIIMVMTGGNDRYLGWQLTPLLTFTGTLSAVSLATWATQKWMQFRFPPVLSDSSFFVYALHIEFALPLGFFIAKAVTLHSDNPYIMTFRYLLTPVIIYAICLAIYAFLRRFWPRILSVLTGNR